MPDQLTMQTEALHYDFSKGENPAQPIRVRKRVRVKVKQGKRYKNNSRKQPLTNLKVKNWVTLAAFVFLLIALVGGLFYVAYNHFPENETYQEYQPVSSTATSTLE